MVTTDDNLETMAAERILHNGSPDSMSAEKITPPILVSLTHAHLVYAHLVVSEFLHP